MTVESHVTAVGYCSSHMATSSADGYVIGRSHDPALDGQSAGGWGRGSREARVDLLLLRNLRPAHRAEPGLQKRMRVELKFRTYLNYRIYTVLSNLQR